MRQIIYVSERAVPLDRSEMERIWIQSQHHNALNGVTGVLWSDGERFAQVLEGGDAAVENTMARITVDPRHRDVQVITNKIVFEREFGDWSMIRPERDGVGSPVFHVANDKLRRLKSKAAGLFMLTINGGASAA